MQQITDTEGSLHISIVDPQSSKEWRKVMDRFALETTICKVLLVTHSLTHSLFETMLHYTHTHTYIYVGNESYVLAGMAGMVSLFQ